MRTACLPLAVVALLCSVVWGQMEIGEVSGTVVDSSNARVAKAAVFLSNPLTGRRARTHSDDQGEFRFDDVPYGSYLVRVRASGFHLAEARVEVGSNIAVMVPVRLAVATSEARVTVEAPDLPRRETARPETVIDESYIKLTPTVVRRDQLQGLVSTTPGWNTENDGLMHIRGVDDGTLYVVGGVPTPDRLDGLFAGSLNTEAITSLEVITGNIPAEFGDRSGSVVVVQPKSGLE